MIANFRVFGAIGDVLQRICEEEAEDEKGVIDLVEGVDYTEKGKENGQARVCKVLQCNQGFTDGDGSVSG